MSEILAPVGGEDSLIAAVRCGADAVYLGSENFNARRNAANFDSEQLKSAVDYCHAHGVKVYHTLNTLLKDSETDEFVKELERILARGEDALILQDLGAIEIVKKICPGIPLHASTQLTVHNTDGVKAMEEMGFKRVVLAREMSREEIALVRKNTDLELEVFVHGALCMCVSGQCYLSSMLGGRSGNRGLCAQPCRLNFKASPFSQYDLSLKDNSLLKHLREMAALGIDSFKIEGRMKRPEYVAASVGTAVKALSGEDIGQELSELQSIFSRSGFTDGYYTGRRGKNMFGFRSYKDVVSADGKLLKKYAALYSKEHARVAVGIKAEIKSGEVPRVTFSALGKSVEISGEVVPEKAVHRELGAEEVEQRLSKLGGTPFYAQGVSVDVQRGLSLSAGEINKLRRQAAEALQAELCKVNKYDFSSTLPELLQSVHKNDGLYLRVSSFDQCAEIENGDCDKIIFPAAECGNFVGKYNCSKLVAELPRVCFDGAVLKRLVASCSERGVNAFAVGNIGAYKAVKDMGKECLPFYGMNIFNSFSAAALECKELVLSHELSFDEIAEIKSEKKLGVIVYGHLPLMVSRNCPIKNVKSCDECKNKSFLTDRKGEKIPVRCAYGVSEVFNSHPLYVADKQLNNTDFSVAYFTTETAKEVKATLKKIKNKEKPTGQFTRGLYLKGVL